MHRVPIAPVPMPGRSTSGSAWRTGGIEGLSAMDAVRSFWSTDPTRVPQSVCGLKDRTADNRVDSRVRETRLAAN